MCTLFNSMHPAVASSVLHASLMRDVGSLVAQVSVLRPGVFPYGSSYTAATFFAHSICLPYV